MPNLERKRPPRLKRSERHERIVDAALAAFSRHGYRGATTRQLARAAGITEVTLFRHFATKEKLFGAVLDKYSILPVLRAEMAQPSRPGDARATLRDIGRKFLGILQQRQDIIRLMLSEAATNPRQAQMLFRQGPGRFLEDMTRLLSRLHARGEIRRVDFRLVARAVLGVHFSFILMQELFFARETEAVDLDRAAGQLSDLLWRGLRPDRSPRKGAQRT
jgi:AcrR family transcriptional regulator